MSQVWQSTCDPLLLMWIVNQDHRLVGRIGYAPFIEICTRFSERALPMYEQENPNDHRTRDAIQATKRWCKNRSGRNERDAFEKAYVSVLTMSQYSNGAGLDNDDLPYPESSLAIAARSVYDGLSQSSRVMVLAHLTANSIVYNSGRHIATQYKPSVWAARVIRRAIKNPFSN